MSQKLTEKRIALRLEFSLRGKNKIPAVGFIGVGDFGVPLTAHGDEEQAVAFSNLVRLHISFASR